MTAPPATREDIAAARFVDDHELRRRLAPTMGWDRFRALIRELESEGFPAINRRWGLRDWKKVESWLDDPDRNRTHAGIEAEPEDGPETFDAAPQRRARTKDRPHPEGRDAVALLVRPQRRA
jgi:hypothetical protein